MVTKKKFHNVESDLDIELSKHLLSQCDSFDGAIKNPSKIKFDERVEKDYIEDIKYGDMLYIETDNPKDIYYTKVNTLIKGINVLLRTYSETNKKNIEKIDEIHKLIKEYYDKYPKEVESTLKSHITVGKRINESEDFLDYIDSFAKKNDKVKMDIGEDYKPIFEEALQDNANGKFRREDWFRLKINKN